MFAKNSLVALCAAASIGQVAAGVFHRHVHPIHKKAVVVETDVVVVTDVVTVIVTDGQEAAAPATPAPAPTSEAPAAPVVVVETTVVPAPAAPAATTFSKVAKPAETTPEQSVAAVAPSVAPVVSSAAAIISAAAVAPASTSAAPAATTSSSSSGTKRGLAYNEASFLTLFASKCSWAYNWGSTPDGTIPSGLEYVPMLWGTGSDHTAQWESNANAALADGSTHLLSFNEPDNQGQANLSPAAAAAGHQQYMNSFAGKAKIGSPAVTSTDAPGFGLSWFEQWKTACNGACSYDFCPVHWYGAATEATNFIEFVNGAVTSCDGKPVWVTEFAPVSGSDSDVADFVSTVIPQLDSISGVERYSYFMLSRGSLVDATDTTEDTPSMAGNAYLAA